MGLAEALNLKDEYGQDSSGEWSRVQIPPGPPPHERDLATFRLSF